MRAYTDSELLYAARRHEARFSDNIPDERRPLVHLPARIGWMNDPNGFSFFQGRYHLFYQYYPYDSKWGPMHWGHALSEDLVHWEHLPAALAPDEPYDAFGCFSGSAIVLEDGRHMLMYTGVQRVGKNPDGSDECKQTQCIAFGDGVDYVKYEGNPVIDERLLPEGANPEHFRDPKLWRDHNGTFHCVAGSLDAEGSGQILQFKSANGIDWEYEGLLAANHGRYGNMWECPDTFTLDGKQVLLVSPQDMLAEGYHFSSGNGTLCLIGHLDDETGALVEESVQSIDHGIDFYATQTLVSPDGRRIMVAWMQNWDTISIGNNLPWFGQMTIPRELSVKNNRLYQWPVRELERVRCNRVVYKDVRIEEDTALPGISGRCVDLTLSVRPEDPDNPYHEFTLWFAKKGQFHSSLRFKPAEGIIKLNRRHSGLRRAVVKDCKCVVRNYDGTLRLRVILDRFSIEVFVGEGEQTMTMTIPTDPTFDDISFYAEGTAVMDIEKYDLTGSGFGARK